MIEVTETESVKEINYLAWALIEIRKEIKDIENKIYDKINNPLKNSPHILKDLLETPYILPYPPKIALPCLDYPRDGYKV